MAGLQIQIGADVSEVVSGVSLLQNQLQRLQKIASLPGLSFKQYERLNALMAKTQAEISKFERGTNLVQTSLSKIPAGANQATQSLTNLGRVVQDAPYGFIGIANNLNPLLESFQRLKASSGSTGSALKALGGSLVGAGGIGLGISLVSSALVLFGDKLFGASKEAKALNEALDNLSKGVANDVVKLTTLVGMINNVNTSNDDRAKALKAVNQEYDGYLKNLGIEEVTLANVNAAYETLIDNLLRQATIKGLQDEISKAVEETAKQILKLEVAEEKRKQKSEANAKAAAAALTPEQQQLKNLQQAYQQSTQVIRDGNIAYIDQQAAINASIDSFDTYENRLSRLKAKLQEQIQPLLNLTTKFSDLGIVLNKPGVDKDFDKIINKAKELAEFMDRSTIREFKFEVNPFDNKEQTLEKAKKFVDDVTKFLQGEFSFAELNQTFRIKPDFVTSMKEDAAEARKKIREDLKQLELVRFDAFKGGLIPIEPTLDLTEFQKQAKREIDKTTLQTYEELQDAFENRYKNIKDVKILFPIELQGIIKNQEEFAASMKSLGENIKKILAQMYTDIVYTAADALGRAIVGGSIENAFQQFVNIIGGALQAIGKEIIAIGTAALLAKTALEVLFQNPAIAIAAGAALVVAGAALKQVLAGGLEAREFGGPVSAGQPYIVGERGKELFIPGVSGMILSNANLNKLESMLGISEMPAMIPAVNSSIIPNKQLRNHQPHIKSGQQVQVTVTGNVRGRDIKLSAARETRAQGRMGIRA